MVNGFMGLAISGWRVDKVLTCIKRAGVFAEEEE